MADAAGPEPITREILLDARLGRARATEHVEVRRIRIVPGHAGGLHVHNGPVLGSIVEGSVIFQIDGEPESLLSTGDVFFEPEGVRIARFDAGDDGVTFLAYFLLAAGEQPELNFPDR
jgi:quercetin dioxygenase-like cupin family protein